MSTLYVKYPDPSAGSVSPGAFPLLAPDGSAASPSYSFSSFPGTGIFDVNGSLHFATAGVDAGNISTSQAWTIGASGSTATHLVNGGILALEATQAAISDIEVDNLSNSGSAGAAFITVTGDGTTSSQYSYFQSRNRQTTNVNWFAGTVGSNNYSINFGAGTTASASTNYLNINTSGALTLGASSGTQQHALNTATGVNASGILTLTNAPSGVSGNPTGYIHISINGSGHFIPYW